VVDDLGKASSSGPAGLLPGGGFSAVRLPRGADRSGRDAIALVAALV
jgi:hypothetical protein